MSFYLSLLRHLESTICQSDPHFFSDPDTRKELYSKNIEQLRGNIYFLFIYWIAHLFFHFQPSCHIFWLSFLSIHVAGLICFCRTRIWIFYWIYTLSLTFGQVFFIEMIKDSIMYAIITSFITPLFVMGVTRNPIHVYFTFFGQLVLLHVRYKYMLEDVLKDMDPAAFSQKFVTAATSLIIAITLAFTLIFKEIQDNQKRMKEAKLEAEHACSQLTLFLQTFSHELRNPLNSLLGNLELALQENLSQKVYEMVETSKICGDILLQLINNILDTKKAQTGKLDISLSPVNMTEHITGTWRISRDIMKRKKLNGSLKVDENLPAILNLDSYRLNQVLLNLLSNAIKFTEKGQVLVTFSWIPDLEKISEKCFWPCPYDDEGLFEKDYNFMTISRSMNSPNGTIYLDSGVSMIKNFNIKQPGQNSKGVLKIVVRDTGSGIKEEDMKLLFTKFSQVNNDITKNKVGTGLGLYITKEICEAMGGEIRAYSKENVGTTFIVCIPTSTENDIGSVIGISQSIENLRHKKLKVMVVDDNIFNSDLIVSYISKIDGQVVETARNGLDGFYKYQNLRRSRGVDVIFLDIDMPVMDGKVMCEKIREFETIEKLSPIKIVFATGNYEDVQMEKLIDKSGMYRGNAFVKKPVSFDIFINTLEKLGK